MHTGFGGKISRKSGKYGKVNVEGSKLSGWAIDIFRCRLLQISGIAI
jgi:hypothetical protein